MAAVNVGEANDVATLLRVATNSLDDRVGGMGGWGPVVDDTAVVDAAIRLRERVMRVLLTAPEVEPGDVLRTLGHLQAARAAER